MKAIIARQPGGPEQLTLVDHDKPVPQNGELLVRVHAAAVNRLDIGHRESRSGSILGVEAAAVVEAAGPETVIPVGARVMGLVKSGAYAEYAVIPEARAMIIPDTLSFVEAAAIPEVYLTAYQTLYWLGKLEPQETVLIHAGGSGVGTAAIQLAKQLSEAKVITTAGSQTKLDYCQTLGADVLINYKEQDFSEVVLETTEGEGADLILDFIGASYWDRNLASVKTDGRWVLIGTLGGSEVEHVNLFSLMQKRVQITGTLLTPRSDAYKVALTKEFYSRTRQLFEDGTLRPVVDKTFTLEDAQHAHEYMESNSNIGKIVLTFASEET